MKALLLVDIQNGFCPGGNLPVPDGDKIVPIANALIDNGGYDLIVASQDWHPADHGSFASRHPGKKPFEMGELSGKPQVLWPDHCVQETADADFHPDLNVQAFDYVQQKGENAAVDSYSAFRDNDHLATTGLGEYLQRQGLTDLDVCGLATDYCVSFSVLDAMEMLPSVKVRFIEDASRGIDPEGIRNAISLMRAKGAGIVNSTDILSD